MQYRVALLATALAVGGVVSHPARAQERERMPERAQPGMEHMQHMREMMDPMRRVGAYAPPRLLEHREALGLTAEQVTRLEALGQQLQQAHEKVEADATAHREQLLQAFQADRPDARAVRTHAQAMMRAQQEAQLAMLGAAAEAKGVLTAEQRGRVAGWLDAQDMMRQRMERRMRRPEAPHQEGGEHRHPRR